MPDDTQPAQIETSITHQSFRSAPIPSPEDFAGYQRVSPDFPERIFKQFEEDSATNRELQRAAQEADIELDRKRQAADIELARKRLDADIAAEKRSQWMAFLLMGGFLVGTVILAYLDKDGASLATGIGAAISAFKGVFAKKPPDRHNDS